MRTDTYYCKRYGVNCPTTINNWVGGDPYVTWFANTLIFLAAIALAALILWYFLAYRRRKFCFNCLENGNRVRTRYSYDGQPACKDHWNERDMDDEAAYQCPKHGDSLLKEKRGGVTIDICSHGCVFLDNGELQEIVSSARSSGTSTGQALGFVIGSTLN